MRLRRLVRRFSGEGVVEMGLGGALRGGARFAGVFEVFEVIRIGGMGLGQLGLLTAIGRCRSVREF